MGYVQENRPGGCGLVDEVCQQAKVVNVIFSCPSISSKRDASIIHGVSIELRLQLKMSEYFLKERGERGGPGWLSHRFSS